jgi:hypothetical protein
LTCESEDSLYECECTFAEELAYLNILSCDDVIHCPNQCPICNTCFHLMGCFKNSNHASASRRNNSLYMIAVALILIFAVGYYIVRKRRAKKNGELGQYLMEDDQHHFLYALQRPSAPPGAATVAESPVWLAPEIAPVQFEPSRLAAMASSSSSSACDRGRSVVLLDESLTSSSGDDDDDEDSITDAGPMMSFYVLPKKSGHDDDDDDDDDEMSPPNVNVWLAPVT